MLTRKRHCCAFITWKTVKILFGKFLFAFKQNKRMCGTEQKNEYMAFVVLLTSKQ